MILSKVYEDAERRLERNEITLGEFESLVDVEVIELKRGRWIYQFRDSENEEYRCSKCGYPQAVKANFCPNCGADMREREGE